MYRVYCLKNEENKIVYIGITKRELRFRMYDHVKSYPHRKNYNIELIEEVEDKSLAEELETYYINFYDTINNGENITSGVGRKGLSSNKTSFKNGNTFGKMGTKPVKCLDTNEVFSSLTECSKRTGVPITKISDCCKGKRKSSRGLHFEYCNN